MSIATVGPPSAPLRPAPAFDLIVVGGVPGAGKTTAIAAATAGLSDVRVLDPERLHHAIRDVTPSWLPYRAYRALIHTGHTLAVLGHLLWGPVEGNRLVVHDPGTRSRRRRIFLGLAELRGWRVALVYLDVDRAAARSGQFRRGRALRPAAFERHWERWQLVRDRLSGDPRPERLELLVDRSRAAEVLRRICTELPPSPTRSFGEVRLDESTPALPTARAA